MTPEHETSKTVAGEQGEHLGFALPPAAAVSRRRLILISIISVLLLGAAFLLGYLPRREARAALVASTAGAQQAAPRIEVVSPKVGASQRSMLLPGSVQALEETTLYARASGFVRRWNADIGDKVKAGQVLAIIDTPDLDQELAQGEAQLKQAAASLVQANANRDLARANLSRYQKLDASLISKSDLDQYVAQAQVGDANVAVAEANLVAQRANSRRLAQLKDYARVTAPFAGMITQRTVEIGALVTAGNGQPLYKVAQTDPARVFVQVPQDVAPAVRPNVATTVMVREYPARAFAGKVTRSAGELDPVTRTMNTEIRVPNADGALMPGMYAEVALTLPLAHRVLELPATALMNDSRGQRVAVIDKDNKLHLVPVVVERDNGATIEIASGLQGTDTVAKIGSAAFVDGMTVEVRR
jgi:RND family efflux transporter MFP subunit